MANAMLAIGTIDIKTIYEEKALSAVVMSSYGIHSVILTEHENLQSLVDEFTNSDDSKWLHGFGKKALYEMLHKRLKKEDTFFKKKPQKMNVNNAKWIDFCNDCVILVALGNVLYEHPIMLLHPKAYQQSVASDEAAWMNGANGRLPSLVHGIQTLTAQ